MKKPIRSAAWAIAIIVGAVGAFTFFRDNLPPDGQTLDLLQKNITLTASDGKTLDAVISIPVPTDSSATASLYPGVILLSPYLESGQVYGPLPVFLGQSGLVVLTVNARYSIGADSTAVLNPADIANLHLDAEAAIRFMEDSPYVAARRIGMLGTGLTARAALIAAGERENITAMALVSAALDEPAMEIVRAASFRPLLILVSIADGPAGGQATNIMAANGHPATKIESYFAAGEDSDIWRAATTNEMNLLIVDWMKVQLSKK